MYRKRNPQRSLFAASTTVPEGKAKLLEKSWAEAFRARALPLIDEDSFAHLYCADNGRPNRPVQIVFGVLLLKDMFDLTDAAALEQLEFNLLWHHALDLTMEEAHLPQKTLHNFRARLLADDQGQLAFKETTDRIIAALGVTVSQQRLDSTHVMSNMAVRTRLGVFCETMRVFLSALKSAAPELYGKVPGGVLRRYIKEDGGGTAYGDARSREGRRRLPVCARDLYRLCHRFEETAAAALPEFRLLQRLLDEQCAVVCSEQPPGDEDDDSGEEPVPVILKAAENVSGSSMQSPHDPDATYSRHKGHGFEAQSAETCHPDNVTEIITHVDVTDASGSDAQATIPVLQALADRGQKPETLVADTTYGSGDNAVQAERMATELVSPVGGAPVEQDPTPADQRPLKGSDFHVDVRGEQPARCPAGHIALERTPRDKTPNRVDLRFDRSTCESCPLRERCPAKPLRDGDGYGVTIDLVTLNVAQRRRAEASGEFWPRYTIRAGIEATASELKRQHGLGHLRVRGRPRVQLAVHLKALACNLKRMIRVLQEPQDLAIPQTA